MLSVVGNRPQFIKSGPVSEALRDAKIEEVVLHTGQHYDDELSQVFFDELGLGEPRYRLEVGGLERDRMLDSLGSGSRRRDRDRAPGLGARLRGHQLDTRRRSAPRPRRASRSRTSRPACAATTDDARGAQPDRDRPALAAPLRPGRALAEDARAGGRRRPGRGDRRRDGGRVLPPGADRARAIGDPGHPRGRACCLCGRDTAPRGECRRAAAFADFEGLCSDRGAGRVPGASAGDGRAATAQGVRPSTT